MTPILCSNFSVCFNCAALTTLTDFLDMFISNKCFPITEELLGVWGNVRPVLFAFYIKDYTDIKRTFSSQVEAAKDEHRKCFSNQILNQERKSLGSGLRFFCVFFKIEFPNYVGCRQHSLIRQVLSTAFLNKISLFWYFLHSITNLLG